MLKEWKIIEQANHNKTTTWQQYGFINFRKFNTWSSHVPFSYSNSKSRFFKFQAIFETRKIMLQRFTYVVKILPTNIVSKMSDILENMQQDKRYSKQTSPKNLASSRKKYYRTYSILFRWINKKNSQLLRYM